MIVDVHTHIPTHPEGVPEGEERTSTVIRPDRPAQLSGSFDDYIRRMEPVDKAIVFGIAMLPGSDPMEVVDASTPTGQNVNDVASRLAALQPDKIIGFMSVHPDDPDVFDEMDRCVHDLGLKGIKLAANYQVFDPLGQPARRLYARAQEVGLPIVFHQGTGAAANAPLRYAHPLVMDEVAMAFPDLKIVMAHIGHPWHADCFVVVRKHPNVYADVSGQLYRPWSMYSGFRLAYEWGVMDQLLLASDWPLTTPQECIDSLRGFNRFARDHRLPEVPDEALEGIIQRDSLKLLGLDD